MRKYRDKMESALEGPFSIHNIKLESEHAAVKKDLLKEFSSKNDFGSKAKKQNLEEKDYLFFNYLRCMKNALFVFRKHSFS